MGTVTRSTKPGGGTDINTGQTIVVADVNTDMNTLFTLVNGNLDADNLAASAVDTSELAVGSVTNAKVAAGADIDPAKLDQTAGARDGSAGLDADIVQAYAADATEYNTQTTPGDSSSISYPEHLEDELERLRYVVMRLALGVNATITDGSSSAAWFDGVSTGANLVQNPAFLDYQASGTTAPQGWTKKGTPSDIDGTTAITAAEGSGHMLTITSAATADGIQQTLFGLKASARYLVEARTRPTTSIHTLKTTGATGTFGNLDIDSADGGSAWATLAGVIETDSTPTDIVLSIEAENGVDVWDVAWVSVREVGTDDKHQRDAPCLVQTATDNTNGSTTTTNLNSNTEIRVVVPGDNYSILVFGQVNFTTTNTVPRADASIQADTDIVGGVSYSDVQTARLENEVPGSGYESSIHLHYAVESATAGNVYGFRLDAGNFSQTNLFSSGTILHRLTVMLVRQG